VARNVVAVKNAGLLDIREILDRGPADLTFARDITNILNAISERKLPRPPRKLGLSAKAGRKWSASSSGTAGAAGAATIPLLSTLERFGSASPLAKLFWVHSQCSIDRNGSFRLQKPYLDVSIIRGLYPSVKCHEVD